MESCNQDLADILNNDNGNGNSNAKVVVDVLSFTNDVSSSACLVSGPSSPAGSVDSGCSSQPGLAEPAHDLEGLLARNMNEDWEESFSDLFPDLI